MERSGTENCFSPDGFGQKGLTWFGRALLALVETPGGAHTSTAIILFG